MKTREVLHIIFKDLLKPLLILPFLLIKTAWKMLQSIYERLIRKLRFSITFRMTSMYTFIITITLLLLSIGIIASGFAYMLKSEGDDLQRDYLLISEYIKEGQSIPEGNIKQLSELSGTSISVYDGSQRLLFTTDKNLEVAVFIDRIKNKVNIIEYRDTNLMLLGNPGRPDNSIPQTVFNEYGFALVLNDSVGEGSNLKYIQIIDKLSQETVYARIFVITLFGLELFFIIIIVMIGHRSIKKLLKPIKVMTDAVNDVTIDQLDMRLDIRGSQNEFRDLAGTFNNMLDRLENSYELQNQFVSDASHELRTPISVIQGYANLLDRWGKDDTKVLEESIAAIKSESEEMKNLIENLLFLARGDKDAQKVEMKVFHINELIDEVVRETKLVDDTHEIICNRNESISIFADYSLLKEAIRIFVDNSLKYTESGGRIEMQCYSKDNKAIISIEDTGIGIPKEDLPHVFERFYRADKSRTKQTGGTGLGMAIAKWIVLRHGGTIKVQSEINVGTKIEVTIPIKI
jgi:two-component system, OmpR family, sensor histidine kinase ArlS